MRYVGGSAINRHVLVDGNNLLKRAHYVFVDNIIKQGKTPYISKDGTQIGLIYGTLSLLTTWLYDLSNITTIEVFFDGKPTRRRIKYPEYKCTNKREPLEQGSVVRLYDGSEFPNQVVLISHILNKLGCNTYYDSDEEADDLIATFVSNHRDSINIIISSDKDFFQLVCDKVILYRPDSESPRLFDEERVIEYNHKKYGCGITPKQYRMFRCLTGDSSDNIHGVWKIRKKAVAPLCCYTSIDDVISSGMQSLSSNERKSLTEMKDQLDINYDIIGLKEDIDLSKCCSIASQDFDTSIKICNYLNINIDTLPFRRNTDKFGLPPREGWLDGI